MIVGMITVFAVLFIIIQLSNLLIRIVNKVAPEEKKKQPAVAAPAPVAVAPDVMEAIRQVVEKITEGKGLVAGVKRI